MSNHLDECRRIITAIYHEKRNDLNDLMFEVGVAGVLPNLQYPYEKVSPEIGVHFDAHGLTKKNILVQFNDLVNLLLQGIDETKTFHTAPFEISDEHKSGVGAGLGTSGGTCYKDGLAIIVSNYRSSLLKTGINFVLINDVFEQIIPILSQEFPKYTFGKLSEQKKLLIPA